jgi:hypothetical protein
VAVRRSAIPRRERRLGTDILDADGVQHEANRHSAQGLGSGEALICVLGYLCSKNRDRGAEVRAAPAPIMERQALALAEPVKL